MIKSSEALNLARTEYINGYEEKDTTIFPTLNLIAKEFSLSLSTLRKKFSKTNPKIKFDRIKTHYGNGYSWSPKFNNNTT